MKNSQKKKSLIFNIYYLNIILLFVHFQYKDNNTYEEEGINLNDLHHDEHR